MKTKYSFLLVTLSALFCTCLIISNIIAGKLWQIGPITFTAGIMLFPIVYILGDIIPECYGLATSRRVIFLGFAMNVFAVIFFSLTLVVHAPDFWKNQDAFVAVLGFTPRLLIASFCGYLVGTNANAWVLVQVKKLTNGKWLWIRTISSTLVGETLDSILFYTIAFYGIIPTALLPQMVLTQAAFKSLYEALATPVTYLVVGYVKRYEGITQ
jgi:queuosine precursor transporter